MKIRIPKNRWEAFVALSTMSDESVKTVFAALASVPPQNYGPDVALQIAASLKDTLGNGIAEVVDTVFSLFPLIISTNKSVDQMLDTVMEAVRQYAAREKELPPDQLDRLRINLKKLLQVPSMSVGAKATGVLFDNPHNFLNARVITDLRPVFELENVNIAGAVILHTLKIEYGAEGTSEKEFFVALDDDDIKSLISKLERALEKGDKMRELINASSVPLLNPAQS